MGSFLRPTTPSERATASLLRDKGSSLKDIGSFLRATTPSERAIASLLEGKGSSLRGATPQDGYTIS